jgi:hypothetical protein
MPRPRLWTDDRDEELRRLRKQGLSWAMIAARLNTTRCAAVERARRLGILGEPTRRAAPETPSTPDPERPPLPPGHSLSWGLLTCGTCLDGEPYPLPVFE